MPYAFYFDSRFCSGCKACQVACKDHNNLPVGILWRRVYEIAGGEWHMQGSAWEHNVYAYNLSIACNHCARPICVEVCPASAISVRTDGIVSLNSDLCIGCQYCSWACPYSAPQFDAAAGRMTKCNFCKDNIDAGIPPACVSACPLRALEFGNRDELAARHPQTRSVYPLPDPVLTQPSLSVTPHATARVAQPAATLLGNREEVYQGHSIKELPLIFFTLVTQSAVGIFGVSTLLNVQQPATLRANPFFFLQLSSVLLTLAGLLVSLMHLGSPQRAWRAITNLRFSWLSREIASGLLFAGLNTLACIASVLSLPFLIPLQYAATVSGILFIFCMARVYTLRSVPPWYSGHTLLAFYLTSGILGTLITALSLSVQASLTTQTHSEITILARIAALLMSLQIINLALANKRIGSQDSLEPGKKRAAGASTVSPFWRILSALMAALIASIPGLLPEIGWLPLLLILASALALFSEIAGRAAFYQAYARAGL